MGVVIGIEGKTAATLAPSSPPPVAAPELVQEQMQAAQLRSQVQVLQAQLDAALAKTAQFENERNQAPAVVVKEDAATAAELSQCRAAMQAEKDRAAGLEADLVESKARYSAQSIEAQGIRQEIEKLAAERDAAIRERDEARKGGKRR